MFIYLLIYITDCFYHILDPCKIKLDSTEVSAHSILARSSFCQQFTRLYTEIHKTKNKTQENPETS